MLRRKENQYPGLILQHVSKASEMLVCKNKNVFPELANTAGQHLFKSLCFSPRTESNRGFPSDSGSRCYPLSSCKKNR